MHNEQEYNKLIAAQLKQFGNQTPLGDLKYKIGDCVTFTNPAGIVFRGITVIGFCPEGEYDRRYYLDYDCWWFPATEASLSNS